MNWTHHLPILAEVRPSLSLFSTDAGGFLLRAAVHGSISAGYLALAGMVWHFMRRRGDPHLHTLLWSWFLLLFALGVIHLIELAAHPLNLSSVAASAWIIAAVQALVTAGLAIWLIPRALVYPGRVELEQMTRQLTQAIAEREQAQAALRHHQELLEREAAARTADLEQAKQALQREIAQREREERERLELERQVQHSQKLESLGLLAGGIAHDFNNLLMGILGNTELALSQAPNSAPIRERLEQVRSAALVAADLTKQMLAYAGKGRFQTQTVFLNGLVENLAQLLRATIPKKTSLHLKLSPNVRPVLADEAQVHQVVMNLITNAAEAIGGRQGVITVETGMMEASEEYLAGCFPREPRTPGPYVFLEVADTGDGMDSATQERIFEPFFTTKFTGRGLGLSAVQGIMRGHRGAVHVDSTPGAGTRMRVLFPPAQEQPRIAVATAPPTRYHGRGATVLVIDDETMVRNTLSAMLKSLGFVVLTAADGQEGVELFRANRSRIAAVLLDMTMPRMNGEETFRELRRIQPNVRTILCSGYSEQEAADRFAGQGLAGFLQKPFGLDSISARLSEVLERTPA